jgi:hypothetical protein
MWGIALLPLTIVEYQRGNFSLASLDFARDRTEKREKCDGYLRDLRVATFVFDFFTFFFSFHLDHTVVTMMTYTYRNSIGRKGWYTNSKGVEGEGEGGNMN